MTVYRSECGKYLCRVSSRGWGHFDAWLADGSIHWRKPEHPGDEFFNLPHIKNPWLSNIDEPEPINI